MIAFEAKRYNMTKHGPITPRYSTMFSGETHLAAGLANILLSSLLLYRVSIKWSSKSGLNSNLWLFLYRPVFDLGVFELLVSVHCPLCCIVLLFAFYQCKGSAYSYITRCKRYRYIYTQPISLLCRNTVSDTAGDIKKQNLNVCSFFFYQSLRGYLDIN